MEEIATNGLPEDLESAHRLIAELSRELERTQRQNEALRHRIDNLCRRIFGRKSEKGLPVPEQGTLPFQTAAGEVAEAASDEDSPQTEVRPHTRRNHRGRKPLPMDLPIEEVVIEPAAGDLVCSRCQEDKVCVGRDVTPTLDFQPASFFIRHYIRPKYACRSCQDGITQSTLPARPIEKGRPEPGLLAHVVTSKYADHLPLYRLEQIFARHGIEITRRTLSQWCGAVADLLSPIVLIGMKAQLLESAWIQTDDTTVDVQDPSRDPAIRRGHMWVYRGSEGDSIFDFTWSRNRDGPTKMVEGYRGYLQADAAPAYDELFNQHPEIVEVGCMAHARRYFEQAVSSAARPALAVMAEIRELYRIEKSAKQLGNEERRRVRERESRPILEKLFTQLDTERQSVLPKSPLAEAMGYALRNRQALMRYLEDGRLKIDNNGAEQDLRPVVLGRKNWLFCGSEAAAHRAAILLSLVTTCKHFGINPLVYLKDVIERVSTHPMSAVLELTPREWKRLREQNASAAAA